MWRYRILLLLGCLLWSLPVAAQLPVTDAGNLLVNTTTSLQAVITAAQMVISVENQLAELLPLEEIIVAGEIAEDLAALADIVSQAEGISYDLQSLNAQITILFALETAPDTREGLDARLGEIKTTIYQARTFAVRTQTLLMTVYRTADHVARLIDSIAAFVGAKQGQQTAVQVQSTVSKTLAVQLTMNTSWQRTDIVERLSADLVRESMARIQERRLDDWPRWD